MRFTLYIIVLLFTIVSCFAYDNIYEFDMNENVIITTTVYNTSGKPCIQCSCNLTIMYPSPDENMTLYSLLMENNNNGVYTKNLYNNISYNKNIYPLLIICNDSLGFYGGDQRDGIKIGETMFDYTAGILALAIVGIGLLFMSFKIDNEFANIKKLCFFASLPFFFLCLGLGYYVMSQAPNSAGFNILMGIAVVAFLMVLLGIVYLYFYKILEATYTKIGRNGRNGE